MAFFRGGPCDGRPALDPLGAERVCGGVTYQLGPDGDYHTLASITGGAPTGALAPHAHSAWTDLQRSVNRHLPTSIARSQAFRHAAVRVLHHKRRIG